MNEIEQLFESLETIEQKFETATTAIGDGTLGLSPPEAASLEAKLLEMGMVAGDLHQALITTRLTKAALN